MAEENEKTFHEVVWGDGGLEAKSRVARPMPELEERKAPERPAAAEEEDPLAALAQLAGVADEPNPEPEPEPEPEEEPEDEPEDDAEAEPETARDIPVAPPHTAALPSSVQHTPLPQPVPQVAAPQPAPVPAPPPPPQTTPQVAPQPVYTPPPQPQVTLPASQPAPARSAQAPAQPAAQPPASNGFTPPSEHSRELAKTVVKAFTDRLSAEARKLGGYLTTRDIDRLSDEFKQKTEELQAIFQVSFDQYVRARERAAVDHARQYPFDRIIVNNFAHLFDPDRNSDDGEFAVTRKVLPGFFIALDKMLGEEQIAQFQERGKEIIERLSPNGEVDVDWELVYQDSESERLCLDALMEMAPYFLDYERRMEWFMRLVNSDLTDDDAWLLTDWGFYNLVEGLFGPLRGAIRDAAKRPGLEERFGGIQCFNAEKTLEAIARVGARED